KSQRVNTHDTRHAHDTHVHDTTHIHTHTTHTRHTHTRQPCVGRRRRRYRVLLLRYSSMRYTMSLISISRPTVSSPCMLPMYWWCRQNPTPAQHMPTYVAYNIYII